MNLELPHGHLPEQAKTILFESNPCPFTTEDVEARLLGTTQFMPKSAIVCLFPYHVQHKGHANLSRYTWSTDYHLVINEYLERLIERLQIIDDSAQFSIHCDTSPLADRYMAYLAGLGFTERTTVLSALNGVLMSLLVRF